MRLWPSRAELPIRRSSDSYVGTLTDNGSEFINETVLVLVYCAETKIEFTRARPYRKNDQAWVEQKNGSVVRRLVGYRRLEGMAAANTSGSAHGRASTRRSARERPNVKPPARLHDGIGNRTAIAVASVITASQETPVKLESIAIT